MKKLLIVFALLAAPAAAQPVPSRVQAIVEALAAQNPTLAFSQNDDDRRALTRLMIEQVVFEFPADGWGGKSADPTRPFSKDSIARQVSGRLLGCDWQNGASRQPNRPVNCDDITGQNFIPVPGANHLSTTPSEPNTPTQMPSQPALTLDLSGVYSRIDAVYAQNERIFAERKSVEAQQAAQVAALSEQLRKHDEEPSWIRQFFTSSKTYMTLAGLLAGYVTSEKVK